MGKLKKFRNLILMKDYTDCYGLPKDMPENENASPMTAEIVEAFRKLIKQHEGIHNGYYFISTNKAAESCAEFFTQQLEEAKRENDKLKKQVDTMREALEEAKLQIEYLHHKFKETGSGKAVLSQIDLALQEGGNDNA